jgi:hypothetical protein
MAPKEQYGCPNDSMKFWSKYGSMVKIVEPFSKRQRENSTGSKVLVCSLHARFREAMDADKQAYSRYYKSVDSALYSRIDELLGALGSGYEIVHLFTPLAAGGFLSDNGTATLLGSELIARCCEKGVKLLWIASENKVDDYVTGFNATGRQLNLIMTISRNGGNFTSFLEQLLSRISIGERLPNAWVALVPQAEGRWQRNLPGCIFFAGHADVKLLS